TGSPTPPLCDSATGARSVAPLETFPACRLQTPRNSVGRCLVLLWCFDAEPLENLLDCHAPLAPSVPLAAGYGDLLVRLFLRKLAHLFLPDVRRVSSTLLLNRFFDDFLALEPPTDSLAVSQQCLRPKLVPIIL